MSELKPCPFCGSDGFNHQGGIICSNSDCFMFNACVSEQFWNNRPIEQDLQNDIGDLSRENIGLKSILKALENIDEYKMQGHECYAKHVLLSLRDRLKRIERGKK